MPSIALAEPDRNDLGPAMAALNERERAFVWALLDNGGDQTAAARAAGYGGLSKDALYVTAHRIAHRERVLAAIREVAERYMRSYGFAMVKVLVDIATNEKSDLSNRRAAAVEVLNRVGLHATTEHKVTVQDDRRSLEELKQALFDILRPKLAAPMIDVTPERAE